MASDVEFDDAQQGLIPESLSGTYGLALFVCGMLALVGLAQPSVAAEDHTTIHVDTPEAGKLEALYAERCVKCHGAPVGRTPSRTALMFVPPHIISRALTSGTMQPMAEGLSKTQIAALAAHLSALPDRPLQSNPAACPTTGTEDVRWPATGEQSSWPATSRDLANRRFQPRPRLRARDVPKLELAWAMGIPGGASGPPVVMDGRLFLSSGGGEILAIDVERACTLWSFEHGRIVRTVTLSSGDAKGAAPLVVFADDMGRVAALDSATGALRWETLIELHPLNRATAAPTVYDGRVFVPMSSIEDPLSHDPSHACCTSRGSVTALDLQTGNIVWKRYTVDEAPVEVVPASELSPARFSPAGGSIYTPLAVDPRRGLIYASTAEAYTDEDAKGAYSVIAFDIEAGTRVWEQQFLPQPDQRASTCEEVGYTDCRNLFSMGTSVMIHTAGADGGEGDLLLVGQKWGFVYALDPERQGAVVWKRRVARGGDMGGIMYGLADDGEAIYVPVSDMYVKPPDRPGDLVALLPGDGSVHWRAEQPDPVCSWGDDASCIGAQSAAPTVIPGVVFASAWDGFVRAHTTATGELLWQFDTGREFPAINGKAQGGQIAAYPIQVVDGNVYVTSGASSQARPGNALLVFRVPE
ncbi:MAG: PQQ-binding-like beta-propeller repeat protein [bacterium]|nr:PQQ-binding-like beta-propeller repeat protein [bacterium]